MFLLTRIFVGFVCLITMGGGVCWADVGFLSPSGVDAAFASKVDFAMVNVYGVDNLQKNLELARKNHLRLYLDMGPEIGIPRPHDKISMDYTDPKSGEARKKILEPLSPIKLRAFSPNLKKIIVQFIPLLKEYENSVSVIFLADEPYLNGLTKLELENSARIVRKALDQAGLQKIKLGVNFASAMFDPSFAHIMNDSFSEYAKTIDTFYVKLKSDDPSRKIYQTARLTTYDQAGNSYLAGGLPRGFDVYTFDAYLSTFLLDSSYNTILEWFVSKKIEPSCNTFVGMTMKDLKEKLTFFRDGPLHDTEEDLDKDKKLLNDLYTCRIGTIVHLLREQMARNSLHAQITLISESSNNGVMEFDSHDQREEGQPPKLIERRVLEEVERAQSFMKRPENHDIKDLMFFLFNNEYDKQIKMNIGGVANMPAVLTSIYAMKGNQAH